MPLKPNELQRDLASALHPLYVLSGDEPLQLEECADLVRAAAREGGFAERVRLQLEPKSDWSELGQYRDTIGLFGDRRLVDLRIAGGKPGVDGAKALTAYAERPNPENLLLVIAAGLNGNDRRAKWYQALESAGRAVVVHPVKAAELPGWIGRRARALGVTLTRGAVELLAERTEGNLLSTDQELRKLHMLHGNVEIDEQMVVDSSAMSARYSVYGLAEAALEGDTDRACRMLRGLREEGAAVALVMWALVREIRTAATAATAVRRGASVPQALREANVWKDRAPAMTSALHRRRATGWYLMLKRAALADRAVKGGSRGDPWDEVERLVLRICGLNVEGRRPRI